MKLRRMALTTRSAMCRPMWTRGPSGAFRLRSLPESRFT